MALNFNVYSPFEPVPIEIQAWGIIVQGGKVHGNQHDPQKMF